jgi:predicted glycogen debranching enzyme
VNIKEFLKKHFQLSNLTMIRTSFDSKFMNDLDSSSGKEYLVTSGNGACCTSTISGCNTRKYHGLLIAKQPQIDDNDHVLVSAIDEQVLYGEKTFETGTHYYPGTVHPSGYKYIAEFSGSPVPRWVYKLDDCVLIKELLMPEGESTIMIRYTVENAAQKIQLKIFPYLAFRINHAPGNAGRQINDATETVGNGIALEPFPQYSRLYLQTSVKGQFITAPDWYYNIEYPCEQRRGYDYREDLFVPGHFLINLKKGDKLVLCISTNEVNSKALSNRYTAMLKKKPALEKEIDCLAGAARQFVVKQNNETTIKAGYHWFGTWGRDTFISLPGLLLATGHADEFIDVIKSSLPDMKNGLLPNLGKGKDAIYNSVDTSLWFVWAIQQYAIYNNSQAKLWAEYGKYLAEILEHYKSGTLYNIKMDSDGLIAAGEQGKSLTWMDAVCDGRQATPRMGKAVEVNALWYNAVCFCLEIAKLGGDEAFIARWEGLPQKIQQSFIGAFWDKEKKYLADIVHNSIADWSVRPNQVFALSMPYSPVPEYSRRSILDVVKNELLTQKGLRTLSPADQDYKGLCEGAQEIRDLAYHQGTIWPWLLGHYVEACINEYGISAIDEIEKIRDDYYALIGDPCLYTVPEIYNGDYPFKPVGAVAQAWSVAEILRIDYLLEKLKQSKEAYRAAMA